MGKPILCLDFDGVIHSYTSGWKGARTIPDPPVPGALDFISQAMLEGWKVVIHSSRASHVGGISAMKSWLREHAGNQWDCMGPSLCDVEFVRMKPPAVVTIDDRALTFTGQWPSLKTIKEFKPWNKRKPIAFGVDSLHSAAPQGYKCADCTMDNEPCPTCYEAAWKVRHPNTVQL